MGSRLILLQLEVLYMALPIDGAWLPPEVGPLPALVSDVEPFIDCPVFTAMVPWLSAKIRVHASSENAIL